MPQKPLVQILEQFEKAITYPGNQNGNEIRELACLIVRLYEAGQLTENEMAWAAKLFVLGVDRVAEG